MAKRSPPKPNKPTDVPRRHLSDGPLEAALYKYKGNLSAVGRSFGVHRVSVWEYVNARPHLLAALKDARETRVDNAESSLDKAVNKGEGWAVTLILKTLGKDRGYVERQEHDVKATTRVLIEEEIVDGPDPDPAQGATLPPAG